ncbi:MAG: IMP dehydrogenase [Desulfurococcales archaeon]|nr:IMP dehydrogenase [Desulfurococcales archaeon]
MPGSPVVGEFLSFDDVVVVPGLASVEPSSVDISGRLSAGRRLAVPVASAPMDTVTGWRLAALLARAGAIGVIHRNMSVDEQVAEVRRVKNESPSIWAEIPKAGPGEPLASLEMRLEEAGAGAAVVVDGGVIRGVYLRRGVDAGYWAGKAEALRVLYETVRPEPTLDDYGRLAVAAAVSPFDVGRAKALDEAGVDVLVVDVAHLHNREALHSLARLVREVSAEVVAGNLGTREGVLDTLSIAEGVAGLRVGISSGSICLTGEVAGASVPTLQAVLNARSALEELGLHGRVPIVADGGIRNPGDAAKALIAGASAVMGGRIFAGTEEALAPKVSVGGRLYKPYRGMASRGAMAARYAADRYSKPSKAIEEGVEGLVPYRGSALGVVAEMAAGLQAALGYAGASSVREAWEKGRLARVTASGRAEIRPHDVILG